MYPTPSLQRRKRVTLVLCSLLGLLVLSGLLPSNNRAFAMASSRSSLAFYNYPVQPPGDLRTAFSASLDNEVYMKWTVSGLTGRHYVHFTVIAPDQSVYQVLDVPVQALRQHNTIVWADLPIAGTWMTRLLGTWHVAVRLDTNPTVLATALFELTQ
jgi:hypothetical protein